MEIHGIDIGFGFTKATNGNAFTIFKSILGDATDIQFRMGIGTGSPGRNLHVSLNGQSYFVGEFAEMQSNVRQFTLDQDKMVNDFVKTLGLTAMALTSEVDSFTGPHHTQFDDLSIIDLDVADGVARLDEEIVRSEIWR